MEPSGWRVAGLLGSAIMSVMGANAPANAQFFGWYGPRVYYPRPYYYRDVEPPMPLSSIPDRLSRQGYRIIGAVRFNGRVAIADVLDGGGQRQRLIIDPDSGAIVQRFVAPPLPPQRLARRDMDVDEPTISRSPAPRAQDDNVARPTPPRPRVAAPAKPKLKPAIVARIHPAPPPAKPGPAVAPATPAVTPTPPALPAAATAATLATSAKANVETPVVTVSAPPAAAPPPVAATIKPAETPPGFANGVPLNPLD